MLLAHDLGTTGDKASLHEDDGRLRLAETVAYGTHFARGGIAEQDPNDWWAAVCRATRRLVAAGDTAPEEIRGIGFSGQMMGAVLLDRRLRPVRPAVIWADHRSTGECRRLVDRVGMERAYRITGHRLDPTYSLSKIVWVRDHEPEVWSRTAHVCLAKDFVVARLTGRLVTEPSDASSTNAYDQGRSRWSTELLEAAELDRAMFPEIVPSTTTVGGLTPEGADAIGLPPGTPVVLGGGDGPMAAVGAGVVDADSGGAYAYLGSSSWVSLAASAPLHDPLMRTMTFDHVVPGQFVPTATMQAGGGSLEWIADILAPGEGGARFARLVAAAGTAAASEEGLFFLPHLLGERSPHWNPHARGTFVGLARHHGPEHLTRAVLEGVAFNLGTSVEAFRECGKTIDRIDAIGGGAASDLWLQILADVWGATVRRRSIVEEANSLGAAVTAGVGVGTLADFGVARTLSQITAEFAPDPTRHRAYRARHALFLDAYRRLEPWFERAAELT